MKKFKDVDGEEFLAVDLDCGTIDLHVEEDRVAPGVVVCLDAATAREVAAHLVELADKLDAQNGVEKACDHVWTDNRDQVWCSKCGKLDEEFEKLREQMEVQA